jgi:outer membrane protein TolC
MSRTAAALLVALAAAPHAAAEPPLTLDDALAEAARANPDLGIARADVASAAADVTTAQAGFLPRLDVSVGFGHTYNGPQFYGATTNPLDGMPVPGGFLPGSDQESYTASIQLRQPIFDGLRSVRQVAQASAASRAAGRQLDEAGLAVGFQVVQRFYELLRQGRVLAVLEATAQRSEELVSRADALYAAGRAPKSDTLQARVNLGNDRINAESQRIRLAQARSALAQALGRTSGGGLEVAAPAAIDTAPAPQPEPPSLEELLERARGRRPALAAQAAQVEAARSAIGAAQADFWPSLAAVGTYSRSAADLYGTGGMYANLSRQYLAQGQLVLSWNLFAGRQTEAAVARARATARRTEAGAEKAAESVAREIADARAAVVALARQVGLASENLAAAEQGLALSSERLDAGLLSQLEARDASLKLTSAQLALVQARIDHAIAVADLSRAVGGAL